MSQRGLHRYCSLGPPRIRPSEHVQKGKTHMSGESNIIRGVAERRLYTWAAVGVCLVVFAGFAKSYYLKGLFGTPELPALRHIHGLVMTLWFGLLLVQARLVATRHVSLHRRLGVFGAVLAGLVLVVGTVTAIDAARRGSSPGPPPSAPISSSSSAPSCASRGPDWDAAITGRCATGTWFRH